MYETKTFNIYNLIAHSISVDTKKFLPILRLCSTSLLYLSDFDDSQQSKNVQSVFISKLSPFLNENIKSITSENNFNISDLFNAPCKVFIKIDTSNKNSAINTLSTLLMKTIYNKARDFLSEKRLAALPIPLQYVMEEFGNLPKIDFVPKIFSLNRGENIFALLVLQSKSQVIQTYGEHVYQEIFDSCQCLFVFALTNVEFARELEAMSGTSEVERKTFTKDKNENDSKSESISKDKEAKVSAEDFLKKNSNEFIFIVKNETPFKCRFIPG
jgi:type IV secretion system protein VirD4